MDNKNVDSLRKALVVGDSVTTFRPRIFFPAFFLVRSGKNKKSIDTPSGNKKNRERGTTTITGRKTGGKDKDKKFTFLPAEVHSFFEEATSSSREQQDEDHLRS